MSPDDLQDRQSRNKDQFLHKQLIFSFFLSPHVTFFIDEKQPLVEVITCHRRAKYAFVLWVYKLEMKITERIYNGHQLQFVPLNPPSYKVFERVLGEHIHKTEHADRDRGGRGRVIPGTIQLFFHIVCVPFELFVAVCSLFTYLVFYY